MMCGERRDYNHPLYAAAEREYAATATISDGWQEKMQRQIGFELLSVFKGASTEAIDDAVERMMSLLNHPASLPSPPGVLG